MPWAAPACRGRSGLTGSLILVAGAPEEAVSDDEGAGLRKFRHVPKFCSQREEAADQVELGAWAEELKREHENLVQKAIGLAIAYCMSRTCHLNIGMLGST